MVFSRTLPALVFAAACVFAVTAANGVAQVEVQQPRAFGYQIGDKFERVVHLTLPSPGTLDPDSLPRKGRVSASLAIDEPIVEERPRADRTEYEITLTYQIINVDPDISDIPVPHHDFEITDGDERSKILIPASRIGVSVLRGRTGGPDSQPNQEPLVLPEDPAPLIALSAVFVLSLAALVLLYRGLPFVSGSGPFARSSRKLRAMRGRTWNDARYAEALQLVHEAFDETAGRTVFPEQLDAFFAAHPSFESSREPIVDFYLQSRVHFFGGPAAADAERYAYADLSDFLATLRRIERGLR